MQISPILNQYQSKQNQNIKPNKIEKKYEAHQTNCNDNIQYSKGFHSIRSIMCATVTSDVTAKKKLNKKILTISILCRFGIAIQLQRPSASCRTNEIFAIK